MVGQGRWRSRRGVPRRGQSLVELALLMPVFILILLGAIDLGRVFYYDARLTSAVKEGALYGIYSPSISDVAQRAYDEAQGQLGTTGAGGDFVVTVTCYASGSDPDTSSPQPTCGDLTNGYGVSGDTIQVRGTYKFRPLTAAIVGIWGSTFTISKTARMVIQ